MTFNEVDLGVGKKQKVWRPNPWEGRISGRPPWNPPTFAGQSTPDDRTDDDPFFSSYAADQVAAKMTTQGAFNAKVMEWAHSFLGVPYSWGGQNYGGVQSEDTEDFTCTHNTNPDPDHHYTAHRVDPVNVIGSSLGQTTGYGIDCSGMVGEAAHSAGLGNGDMTAGTMRSTSLARTIAADNREADWIYVRPGDFLASTGHVVYATGLAVVENGTLQSIPIIHASYTAGEVVRGSYGRVHGTFRPRRWIAP